MDARGPERSGLLSFLLGGNSIVFRIVFLPARKYDFLRLPAAAAGDQP